MAGRREVDALTGKMLEYNLFSSFILWQEGVIQAD
jgi:hypothetical protein